WGTKHDYQDFLRIYVPAGSVLRGMSGLEEWVPARAYGLTQFAGSLLVREGQTATVTIRYSVPADVLAASRFRRYHLTIQHQPAGNLRSLDVAIRGSGGMRLESGAHDSMSAARWTLDPQRDAGLSVSIEGPGHPRPVSLSPARGYPDPYIPFASLHDPRHPL
ncbi:MAG: hypothetical protein JOZ41_03330, partial [Chloroflexi bacterium]|nr:hypothetical protein [Chloroflexota bacterium]